MVGIEVLRGLHRAGDRAGADRVHPGQPRPVPRAGRRLPGLRRRLRPAGAGYQREPVHRRGDRAGRAAAVQAATGGQLFVSDESVQDAAVERSIRPQAIALAVFALVLAITALLVVGQAAGRQLLAGSADNPVLAALGLTRWQLLAAGLLEVTVAVAGRRAAGLRRRGRGLADDADRPGPAGRAASGRLGRRGRARCRASRRSSCCSLARVGWTAWREASVRAELGRARPRRPAAPGSRAWLAASGAPVTVVTGVRLALEPGRGPHRRPGPERHRRHRAVGRRGDGLGDVRRQSACIWSARRALYGQNWDAAMDMQFGAIQPDPVRALIKAVPGITGWTFGVHGTVTLAAAGGVVPAIGLAPGRGPLLAPTMLAGHPPQRPARSCSAPPPCGRAGTGSVSESRSRRPGSPAAADRGRPGDVPRPSGRARSRPPISARARSSRPACWPRRPTRRPAPATTSCC